MDLRRSIILVALAVVSYMLILAWNEDYGQIKEVQKITQSVTQEEQVFETNTQPLSNSDDFSVPEEKIQNSRSDFDKKKITNDAKELIKRNSNIQNIRFNNLLRKSWIGFT